MIRAGLFDPVQNQGSVVVMNERRVGRIAGLGKSFSGAPLLAEFARELPITQQAKLYGQGSSYASRDPMM